MLKRGDFVRLARGWTFMVVLDVDYNTGELTAKYASKWAPSMSDFHQPKYADDCQRRHISGFVPWDGAIPHHMKGFKPMANRYETRMGVSGTFVTRLPNGNICLMLEDGSTPNFPADECREVMPNTFRVKAVGSNYSCHYEVPKMKKPITKGDMLLSDSGNLYIVQEINSRYRNPKSVFKGRRVKLTDI